MTIQIQEEWKLKNGKYKCPYCNKEYSRMGISTHIWRSHGEGVNHDPNKGYVKGSRIGWNKGLTKETDKRVRKTGETYSKRVKSGEIQHAWKGKNLPEKMKNRINNTMKKAHKEGRAWNIGKSRWNNEPSYPEQFFMKVIENEFEDKNYKSEYPCGIYSIDFAWVDKKLAIEIDGAQHERFEEYIERDKRKDKYLTDNEWKVLRIKWSDMYNEPKKYIEIAKKFIDKI